MKFENLQKLTFLVTSSGIPLIPKCHVGRRAFNQKKKEQKTEDLLNHMQKTLGSLLSAHQYKYLTEPVSKTSVCLISLWGGGMERRSVGCPQRKRKRGRRTKKMRYRKRVTEGSHARLVRLVHTSLQASFHNQTARLQRVLTRLWPPLTVKLRERTDILPKCFQQTFMFLLLEVQT